MGGGGGKQYNHKVEVYIQLYIMTKAAIKSFL